MSRPPNVLSKTNCTHAKDKCVAFYDSPSSDTPTTVGWVKGVADGKPRFFGPHVVSRVSGHKVVNNKEYGDGIAVGEFSKPGKKGSNALFTIDLYSPPPLLGRVR